MKWLTDFFVSVVGQILTIPLIFVIIGGYVVENIWLNLLTHTLLFIPLSIVVLYILSMKIRSKSILANIVANFLMALLLLLGAMFISAAILGYMRIFERYSA